jgi:hypothetical protein
MKRSLLILALVCGAVAAVGIRVVRADDAVVEISAHELEDKIRGGMLGQIIGNLNGLPHEMKYIDEPGEVKTYSPSLPAGARTDDDTDLEWVYISEIRRTGNLLLPPDEIVRLWKAHVNNGIWCANRYARDLMELGLEPPLTGSVALNPWSEFNLAGQFVCESFGLMAPAMPQTASRIGLRYTRVAIDGEPAQTTQFFTTMISMAFVESDLDKLLDAGLAAVDPDSEIAGIVTEVRSFHDQRPDDWKWTRRRIKERWQKHGGATRDWNGYELNTASTVAALLYGQKDFVETLRLAFNFGWDCDNNAATAATIVGVIRGRDWLDAHNWPIKDVYRNTTRGQMPNDETITGFEDKVIGCARLVILNNGGEVLSRNGQAVYRIRAQSPGNVERLSPPQDSVAKLRAQLGSRLANDLSKSGPEAARAAYLAICLDLADSLQESDPQALKNGLDELKEYPAVVRDVFAAPLPSAARIQQNAKRLGLEAPAVPRIKSRSTSASGRQPTAHGNCGLAFATRRKPASPACSTGGRGKYSPTGIGSRRASPCAAIPTTASVAVACRHPSSSGGATSF